MTKTTLIALMLVIAAAAAGAVFVLRGEPATAVAAAEVAAHAADSDVVVYKSPTCGCCGGWVEHMEAEGYSVSAIDVPEYEELARKKAEYGVPQDLGSCHTSVVGGYTVEGHVPAHVIDRLLRERPDIHGIAVPGMPIGSPGMEGPNPQPYDVIAIGHDGSRTVYESVYPSRVNSDAR